LPLDERTEKVPRGPGGVAKTSSVWYVDTPQRESRIEKILSLVRDGKASVGRRKGRKVDPAKNAKVEQIAERVCSKYYEGLGYVIDPVQKDNRGWDIEAKKGKITLRIEIKGLSGQQNAIELTPNEYRAFASKSESYRLVVVTNCLVKRPKLAVCRFSKEENDWIVDGQNGTVVSVKIRQSASVCF
jgi:hypothetical protein